MKRPSFQFYPGDYLRDAAVRALSLEARGLWVDMLCLMHQAPRRGYLELAPGVPIDDSKLARMVGDSVNRISNLLDEMRLTGVFSEEGGVIFSRRMVRDERRAEINTENGRKGGNPQIKAYSVNRNTTKRPTELPTTPVDSSSTSSSSSKHTPPTPSTHVEGSESEIPIEGRDRLFAVEDTRAVKAKAKSQRNGSSEDKLTPQQRQWFDEFWANVWAKIGVGAARRAYGKKVRDEQTAAKVLAGAKRYTESVQNTERRYWKHPSTWLNGEHWLDELPAANTPAPAAPQSYLPEYPAPERRGHDPKAYEIDFWKEGGWE